MSCLLILSMDFCDYLWMDGNNAQLGGRWCVRDGCGITCAVITWMLIGYAEFCVLVLFLTSDTGYDFHQAVNAVIFHIFIILASTSHVKTMFTDPGAVPKGTATDEYIQRMGLKIGQVIYKCGKCSSIKPERAHHCSVCQRCIRRMDHHCPWVNNCVGENNQKYFVLFTFYIAVLSIHTLYWSVWQFTTCLNDDWRSCAVFSPPATTIFLVMLLFEAVLFAIFTSVMCGTQLHAIMTDETGIEQLKHETPTWDRNDRWKSLQSVFGGRFSLQWLSPFHEPYLSKKSYQFSV